MSKSVERIELPGVGTRTVFTTSAGVSVGVIAHHSGEKEVLVYSADDPDRCSSVMRLEPAEAQMMADLLGLDAAVDEAEASVPQ
jgi:TrkA domain protein